MKQFLAFDTETALITDDCLTPPLTCVSYAYGDQSGVLDHVEGVAWFREILKTTAQDKNFLVGHNVAFDMAVMMAEDPSLTPLIFDAYNSGNVLDTKLLAQLRDIEIGRFEKKYNLAVLIQRFFGVVLDKTTYRLGYGELRGVPLDTWDPGERQYVIDDSRWTLALADHIGRQTGDSEQSQGAWALHLMSCRGLATDPEQVMRMDDKFHTKLDELTKFLVSKNFLRVTPSRIKENKEQVQNYVLEALGERAAKTPKGAIKTTEKVLKMCSNPLLDTLVKYKKEAKKGEVSLQDQELLLKLGLIETIPESVSKDMKVIREAVAMAYQDHFLELPRTEKGEISTSVDTLKESRDEDLMKISDYTHTEKMLSTYIDAFKKPKIMPRYNPLVSTGRTSSYKPNVQNIPRESGLRDCFVPRDGFYFVACDYDTLELRTLAQTCLTLFGKSQLAQAFWDGLDPHLWLGAMLAGVSYEHALKNKKEPKIKFYRQLAKIANFGYPGGLGALSFVSYAAGYGVTLTPEEAQDLKNKWLQAWPEMELYFIYVNQCIEEQGQIALPMSGRVKGDIKFTQAANYLFQGAAADGAKEACYRVAEACYNKPENPLYGCHPVAFIHDEILAEVLIQKAHEASEELSRIMCEAMKKFCPDIPITAGPALMDRWMKEADEVRDENGRLVLWTPGA